MSSACLPVSLVCQGSKPSEANLVASNWRRPLSNFLAPTPLGHPAQTLRRLTQRELALRLEKEHGFWWFLALFHVKRRTSSRVTFWTVLSKWSLVVQGGAMRQHLQTTLIDERRLLLLPSGLLTFLTPIHDLRQGVHIGHFLLLAVKIINRTAIQRDKSGLWKTHAANPQTREESLKTLSYTSSVLILLLFLPLCCKDPLAQCSSGWCFQFEPQKISVGIIVSK